jgi:hypothetical protein
MQKDRGYKGNNMRALMIQEELKAKRKKQEKIYGYFVVSAISISIGIWLGVALTNGTW